MEDSPTASIGTGIPMLATQPGVSVEHVLENTGFELLQVDCMDQNPPQTAEEPWTLREEVDPDGLYI